MRFLGFLLSVFFMFLFIAFGLLLLGIAINETIVFPRIDLVMDYMIHDFQARLITGIVGAILVLISFSPLRAMLGTMQREKTITFDSPDGEVQITTSAVEDLVRRIGSDLLGIKEIKPRIVSTRKGLEILSRVTFYSDVNIPETAEKLQILVKRRLQEMLGIDRPITIKIRVTKLAEVESARKKKEREEEEEEYIPYC